jgi:hypothetical protein
MDHLNAALFSGAVGLSLCWQRCISNNKQLNVFTPSIGNKEIFSADLLPYIAEQIEPENDAPQAEFHCQRVEEAAAMHRANAFLKLQNQRRSLRFFSKDSFPEELLLTCIATAGTAPSGAHQQPWHFSVVKSPDLKSQIRAVVEKEEQQNYDKRMKKTWVEDLEPIFKDSALHKDGE